MSEPIRRLELFTGAGRRRAWSDEEKAAIVAESDGPGTSISAVARRHGLSASQLFTWRRLVRQAGEHDGERPLQFVPAVLSVGPQESTSAELSPDVGERCGGHSIEVEIAGATVRIAQGASAAQIAALVEGLDWKRVHAARAVGVPAVAG